VAGGRFLQDVTEGTMAGGPYWRKGLLGYSNMDQRYEWVTIDGFNTHVDELSPACRPPVRRRRLSCPAVFTDQGWLGEANVGKPVAMRTVIRIEKQRPTRFSRSTSRCRAGRRSSWTGRSIRAWLVELIFRRARVSCPQGGHAHGKSHASSPRNLP